MTSETKNDVIDNEWRRHKTDSTEDIIKNQIKID